MTKQPQDEDEIAKRLQWKAQYSTGEITIDTSHRFAVELMVGALPAIGKTNQAACAQVLASCMELLGALKLHAQLEETRFHLFSLTSDAIALHRQKHRDQLTEMEAAIRKAASGSDPLPTASVLQIFEKIVDHIEEEARELL